MNITFLIGNGFDLNLGLNTRYSDFYPYFVAHASKNNMIKYWLTADELLWADLEEKLGEKLNNVKESEQGKFYEDKTELDSLLLEYLENEQKRVSYKSKEKEIADEMARSLISFSDDLSETGRNSIDATRQKFANENFKYCFVSFNYTDILDRIVNITHKLKNPVTNHRHYSNVINNYLGKIIHIHGTLNEEMILGVNDESQINNTFLKNDSEFLDTFIKKRMNDNIGQRKTEHTKELLSESHIICIFGMSIGNTDKMWWEEIADWLTQSECNKLIIYYKGFDNELKKRFPSNTIRLNNKLKKEILEKGGIDINNSHFDDLKNRIFISYNSNIFNFKEIEGLICPF